MILFARRGSKLSVRGYHSSQAEVAALCGVSREMWGKYERGVAVPGGELLAAFARIGANVQFILTGESSGITLSRDEMELLQHYRQGDHYRSKVQFCRP